MKNLFFAGAVLAFGTSIFVTGGAPSAAAQGPAGAGASTAAQDNTHMLNPMNWMKKDSKNSADAPANRTESEKKLTPALQAQGALPANVNTTDACASFKTLDGCLAALHASHNLGVDFNCLRAGVTGVHINADMSGCKAAGLSLLASTQGVSPMYLARAVRDSSTLRSYSWRSSPTLVWRTSRS